MSVIVRFAPSPTGYLHIGNARTAIFNWLFAMKHGGKFILRLDDTDVERSKDEYAQAIVEDMHWLGINFHETFKQSDKLARYDEVANQLRASGRLYGCYETADELDRKRKRQMARGVPPVYDRAGLKLTAEERATYEAEGRKPHWRLLLNDVDIHFTDGIRGDVRIGAGSMSDPVLIREDGSPLYTFTSVVDDADSGVTHIIRGEDHVTNSGVQIQLFEAMGAKAPTFAHHNLLTTASGEGLSKRLGSLSLRGLAADGFEPMTVAALAALIGTSDAVTPVKDMQALAHMFDFHKVSRSPAKFDPAELVVLNARTLHEMDYADVAAKLKALNIQADDALWLAVRGNISFVKDVQGWGDIISKPITPPELSAEDAEYVRAAAASLPVEWNGDTWKIWIDSLKASTGRKGKPLFMPLRQAITGLDHGPEMAQLLPLIERDEVLRRLGH